MSQRKIEPGLTYHIYNRGNNNCRIYVADFQKWYFSSFDNYQLRDPGNLLSDELFKDDDLHNSIMSLHKEKLNSDNRK